MMMPVTISPDSGDVGAGEHWARLVSGALGVNQPSQFVDTGQFTAPGLYGFEKVGSRDPAVPIPFLPNFGADLGRMHDIDLLHGEAFERVAGAVFADPHPTDWARAIHELGRIVTFVGDIAPLLSGQISKEWIESLWIAQLPLVVRAWDSGIGTAPPELA